MELQQRTDYAQLPTEDVERAPVPSLEELQRASAASMQKQSGGQQAPISSPLAPQPVILTTTTTMTTSAPASRDSCLTKSCCCCFSLTTGVLILAALDVVSALMKMVFVAGIFFAEAEEGKIDKMIEKQDAKHENDPAPETTQTGADGEEQQQMSTEDKVDAVNSAINLMAWLAPFYLLWAFCGMWFACKGLKAARQADPAAAALYYKWKTITVAFAVLGVLMSGTSGLGELALSIYFAVVARSYLKSLVTPDAAVLPSAQANPVIIVAQAPIV